MAEEVVHQVFREIPADWDDLLQEDDLEQQALQVLGRLVAEQLEYEQRTPAFVTTGPIAQQLREARQELEIKDGRSGLYEAILDLPPRQFNVIVLCHLMGYKTARIARFMGLDPRTTPCPPPPHSPSSPNSPHEQAQAILLRVIIGLDAASAGRILGKQPGTIRAAAHRGLRNLARRLRSPTPTGTTV